MLPTQPVQTSPTAPCPLSRCSSVGTLAAVPLWSLYPAWPRSSPPPCPMFSMGVVSSAALEAQITNNYSCGIGFWTCNQCLECDCGCQSLRRRDGLEGGSGGRCKVSSGYSPKSCSGVPVNPPSLPLQPTPGRPSFGANAS